MVSHIQRQYESGKSLGYKFDQGQHDEFVSTLEVANAEDVAYGQGFAGEGAGQLVAPFVHVLEMYPDCWPGPGQGRGDCEAHNCKNAGLGTHVMDVKLGVADEVTGLVEAPVEVSDTGRKNGVFAVEPIYLHAGHSNRKDRNGDYVDDGWHVAAGMKVMTSKTGVVIRDNYPELNADYTKYKAENGGGRSIDSKFLEVTGKNLFRTATQCRGEGNRDMLNRGYFIGSDGGESFSNQRNEHGVSSRTSKGWSHAMPYIGYDDRPWAHQNYGGPLTLILNSWRFWNSGDRDIYDSAQYVPADKRELWIALDIVNPKTGNIMIPRGSFWARAKDIVNRRCMAISGLNGWSRPKLPNYEGGW